MKDGAWVRARISADGFEEGLQEHLAIKWIGPDTDAVFEKEEVILPDSSSAVLWSSIGIDPDRKREPGTYTIEVYRNDSILTSGSFVLRRGDS